MQYQPLIEKRQYDILSEGVGFFFNTDWETDLTYTPNNKSDNYKVLTHKEGLIWNLFLKEGSVFYPEQSDWKYFVSLFGGNFEDICVVAEHYPDKRLIINEYNDEAYQLYKSVKHESKELIEIYLKLFNTIPKEISKIKLVSWYKHLKNNFRSNFTQRRDVENAAFLLFLLNFSSSEIASELFKRKDLLRQKALKGIENIKNWKKLLSKTSLYNTSYRNVPIPESKSFIYSTPPLYHSTHENKSVFQWRHQEYREFFTYMEQLNSRYNSHSIAISNNSNYNLRKILSPENGWDYNVVDYERSLSEEQVPRSLLRINQLKCEALVTNYKVSGSSSNNRYSKARVHNYTNIYSESYKRFEKSLI